MTTKKELVKSKPIAHDRYIYIGDNVGLDLIKDSVFIGGMPNSIKDRLNKYPEIKRLFVPLSEMVEAKKRLKEVGSVEYLANIAIKEVR